MLAVLLLAGSVAAAAVLFWTRSRFPGAVHPRLDRGLGVLCVLLSVVLVLAWPSQTVRGWLGYQDPGLCLGKDRPLPEIVGPPATIESLKADIRQQRLDTGPPNTLEAVGTVQLDLVTGPGSSGETDRRWRVGGTDLGHPFLLDGRLGLVFGDTFGVPAPTGPQWRSNALGWVDDPSGDQLRITAMTERRSGIAGELLGSLKLNGWEQTVIPTNSVGVSNRIVLHWMSVACWGQHGRWVVRQSGLAVSTNEGRSFTRAPGARWPAGSGFAQVAFVPTGDHVHVFGFPEGRDGPARLARVASDDILDLRAWRYWDGTDWVPDVGDAVEVVPAPVSELSVGWSAHHQRWLMVYLDVQRGGVVLRTAPELTGPWSRAKLMVSSLEVPSLYAPYLLPGTGDDATIRYTLSRFDIYNVVLMQTRLEER